MKNLIEKIKNLNRKIKVIILIILVVTGFFTWKTINPTQSTPQYQTAKVEKGNLVVSLAESGQVSIANKVSIVTQASGVVSNVYVKSGDKVNAGDKIADVTLDTAGQQRQAQAYSSLLSAQNSLNSANAQLYTLQNNLFVANQKFVNDKGIANPTDKDKTDPVYIEENATWLAAEAAYKNQSGVITQAQIGLSNASLSYQLTSSTIVAPASGTVSDLMITKGMQIGSSNTTAGSSTNTSNQEIAAIKTGNSTAITINISEVDVPKIKIGQKATITFDALTGKTFTGKVVGINTTGSVSSGVTTYPAIIELDSTEDSILPNMNATANVITAVKENVLLVPSAAVQTSGTQSTVKILKNGQASAVTVETGDSSDSLTEITSGLTEGETVITSTVTTTNSKTTTSPFSNTFRIGGGGGSGGTGGR